jgi:hypothetical protein
MSKREAFNFYRSYYDVFQLLKTHKEKAEFITALLDKQFKGLEPKGLEGMVLFAYTSQQHSINKQIKGWEDKTKSQLSDPCQGGADTPTEQEKGQEKEKGKEEGEYTQPAATDARGLTQKQTAFLTWFNSMMLKHKNVQGKFRSMTKTDKNNLRNLRAAYEDITDWEKAFVSMTKSKWVIDNNKCTVDHFLRMDNFVKYLNEFEVTQSDKKKIRAPWD